MVGLYARNMLIASDPFSFVLFGASGHLAKIKIYPALFTLALKKKLPENYAIIGFSRTEISDEDFRELVANAIRSKQDTIDEVELQKFLSHVFYHTGQYTELASFTSLKERLQTIESGWGSSIRIGYYSVPPSVFGPISQNISQAKLREDCTALRLIVEKPIGDNLESFKEVQNTLTESFSEEEVYLLDHYLGKEAVRNAYFLRYANPIIERILKNTLIHHVEITRSESAGIENRAGYFEHTGTFRDMFQSHMIAIMSLLTMRLTDSTEELRHHRKMALGQIYLPPATNLNDIVLQGQYANGRIHDEQVVGYTEEEGVKPDSKTNTYSALKLMTRISRWEGVPFYLRSGKRLNKREMRISIIFQEPHDLQGDSGPNRVDFILQGEAGIRFHLQTKVAGIEPTFRPLLVTDPLIPTGDVLPEHGQLLLEVMRGNKEWFLNFDEVHTAWRLIDPLQAHLDQDSTPLYNYTAGSDGPVEAHNWIEKDNTNWVQ